MKNKVPQRLQPILWSAEVKNLYIKKDRNYIIHQVLMYGSLSDIKWLFGVYTPETIKEVFISSPKRIYTKPIFRLVKDFILDIKEVDIEEERYVRTSF